MTVDKNLENTNQEVQQCKGKNIKHPEVFSLALSNYDKEEQIYEYAKKADLYYNSFEDYHDEPIEAFKQKWEYLKALLAENGISIIQKKYYPQFIEELLYPRVIIDDDYYIPNCGKPYMPNGHTEILSNDEKTQEAIIRCAELANIPLYDTEWEAQDLGPQDIEHFKQLLVENGYKITRDRARNWLYTCEYVIPIYNDN
ncbi:MAG: hypothetical protein IKJ52_06790 [Muribaculaceae bacterium]|nr:hypothetical protein [Muribaculaceae bacterium]